MRSLRWIVLLGCAAVGAGACVPIPPDVSSAFAPVHPGEPSNYHRRAGSAQATPPAQPSAAASAAPPTAPASTATALEGAKP